MTATAPAPKPAPLNSTNSALYIATKAPKGGDYSDHGAKSVRFRAKSWNRAEITAKNRNLRLEGLHIITHHSEHIGWHVRASNSQAGCFHLYYFKQLIDTSKGVGSKARFEFICEWLTSKAATPNQLCVADASNPDSAIKKYAP